MAKQFVYLIEGKHKSGKFFCQEFCVVAKDESEAQEELRACLDNYEPVLEWRIVSLKNISNFKDSENFNYERDGPFTLYDPTFHFINKH